MTNRERFLAGEPFNIVQQPRHYKFCAGNGEFSTNTLGINTTNSVYEFRYYCKVPVVSEKFFTYEVSIFGQIKYGRVDFDNLWFFLKDTPS